MPAASLIRVTEQKPIAEVDDQTLLLADIGRKAIKQLEKAATDLLIEHIPAEKASAIAKQLTSGDWTHDYPILPSEAKEIGLLVKTDMPPEIMELMTLYPQPSRAQANVQYLPTRRERPAPAPTPMRSP